MSYRIIPLQLRANKSEYIPPNQLAWVRMDPSSMHNVNDNKMLLQTVVMLRSYWCFVLLLYCKESRLDRSDVFTIREETMIFLWNDIFFYELSIIRTRTIYTTNLSIYKKKRATVCNDNTFMIIYGTNQRLKSNHVGGSVLPSHCLQHVRKHGSIGRRAWRGTPHWRLSTKTSNG